MVAIPPLSLRVYKSTTAPNTIMSTLKALPNPPNVAAIMNRSGIFQIKAAVRTPASQANGMARVAGQLKPTIKINATMIGIAAAIAKIETDILVQSPFYSF